jgi:hypothetical protein
MLESWAVTSALVFLAFLLVGVHDRAAMPLVIVVAALLGAELVAATVCLLKGYPGVGWLGALAWLAYPIGSSLSSAMFPESFEPSLLGSTIGAGVILVVAALATITAFRPSRWGSYWDRAGWSRRTDRG